MIRSLHKATKSSSSMKSNNKTNRHFVFGYGSLMCPKSRKITVPDLCEQAQPVVVKNVERVWSARAGEMTAMGVRFRQGAECNGVLLQVSDDQLQRFDARELGYTRYKVELDHVEHVPFLKSHLKDDNHAVFQAKQDSSMNNNEKDVFVWIYVQDDFLEASPDYPIAQSYVDVIIRGCLSISDEFAQSFMETTKGWHSNHHSLGHLVDDRHDPIYIRSDSEFSEENGDVVDDLLRKHCPEALDKRRRRGDDDEDK